MKIRKNRDYSAFKMYTGTLFGDISFKRSRGSIDALVRDSLVPGYSLVDVIGALGNHILLVQLTSEDL